MLHEAHETFGRLEVLVSNAGFQTWKSLLELHEEDRDRVLASNLKGSFLCTQQAGRRTQTNGGAIINIGSGCNKLPFRNLVDCTTSKGGVEMFTKVDAEELRQWRIRVDCVAPGAIEMERTKAIANRDHAAFEMTVLLAERMDVSVINLLSGCPGDSPTALYPNWCTLLGRWNTTNYGHGNGTRLPSRTGSGRQPIPKRMACGLQSKCAPNLWSTTRRQLSSCEKPRERTSGGISIPVTCSGWALICRLPSVSWPRQFSMYTTRGGPSTAPTCLWTVASMGSLMRRYR
jgi:hypothetical protein